MSSNLVAALPYGRRFLLLPDEAVNHVRVLPEQERGRWFFGFWTAPAGWPPLPPSAGKTDNT